MNSTQDSKVPNLHRMLPFLQSNCVVLLIPMISACPPKDLLSVPSSLPEAAGGKVSTTVLT